MANIRSSYQELEIPFTKMSWTPDVPTSQLGPNEYNSGQNIETDVRGIKSVLGQQGILSKVPNNYVPVYITGGYRQDGNWYYIVGAWNSVTNTGYWYQVSSTTITNITPGVGTNPSASVPNWTSVPNITEAWNGTSLIINDGYNAPYFIQGNETELEYYKLQASGDITNIVVAAGTATVTLSAAPNVAYAIGDKIVIQDAFPPEWNTEYIVTGTPSSTQVQFTDPGYPAWNNGGLLRPKYQWNYNPDWTNLVCGFLRVYNAPNVGSVLIAGDLTATLPGPTTVRGPNTVRWSQNFGLNEVPQTWAPTVTNVANELEVPLRGPVLDGFPANGQFYVCSYWDTVVFSPIAFQTTQVPVFGVRLFNQGRGLLSSNCWVNADDKVYGVDARDIWVFDGNNFNGLGNQRVKNYFFQNVSPTYTRFIFLENNTNKNQVEIYYTSDTTQGNSGIYPDTMISYRYDLDCFNPPRTLNTLAVFATEGPVFRTVNSSNIFDPSTRTVTYLSPQANSNVVHQIFQKDQGYSFTTSTNTSGNILAVFRRDNIQLLKDYSGQLLVHRILPEVNNIDTFGLQTTSVGNVNYNIGGNDSAGEAPTMTGNISLAIDTVDPWVQIDQNAFRLNSLEFSHDSNTAAIIMNSVTWQITQTQDAR